MKLAFFGTNKNYLLKLLDCFRNELDMKYYLFDDYDVLKKFIDKEKIDYLIIDLDLLDSLIISKIELIFKERQIIYLTEEKDKGNKICIQKYQSSKNIYYKILEVIGKNEDIINVNSETLIGVYAPAGMSYKTSLAIYIGYFLMKKENVILLSLDEFSVLNSEKDNQEYYDLSDVFYCLSQEHLTKELFEKSLDTVHGLSYIRPSINQEDMQNISVEQINKLVEWILNQGMFSKIILDIGNNVIDLFKIFYSCNRIFTPVIANKYYEKKYALFESYLRKKGKSQILNKIQKVNISKEFIGNGEWNVNYYDEIFWKEIKDFEWGISDEH